MCSAMKRSVLPVLLAIAFLLPGSAEARGFVLVTHGEDIAEIGEVADEHKESVRTKVGGDAKIDYIHIPCKIVYSRNENRGNNLFDDPRYQQAA